MSNETFEIIDAIENELTSLEFAHTMLSEASYGLSPVINFDKSKEDEGRIQNLLNRREVLEDFVDIATDYIIQAKKTLQEIVNKYSGGGGYNLIVKKDELSLVFFQVLQLLFKGFNSFLFLLFFRYFFMLSIFFKRRAAKIGHFISVNNYKENNVDNSRQKRSNNSNNRASDGFFKIRIVIFYCYFYILRQIN